MNHEFASLKELISQGFANSDRRLDALTEQVREMNGRVRAEEFATADFRPRIITLERELCAGGERRGVRVWDVSLVLVTSALFWAALKALGKIQ